MSVVMRLIMGSRCGEVLIDEMLHNSCECLWATGVYLLDWLWFEAIKAKPPNVRHRLDALGQRISRLGSWYDRWAHASVQSMRNEVHGPSYIV